MTGMALLGAIALVIGANLWLAAGAFVPILRGQQVEYLLVAAPGWVLLLSVAVALAALIAIHTAASRALFDERPARWTGSSLAYVSPLALFALNLVSPLALLPGTHEWLRPWLYLTVDLRVWLAPIVLILFALALDARAGGRAGDAVRRVAGRWGADRFRLELTLVTIAAVFVCVSTPILRFNGSLHGDEPKYIRYCENLYQGRGLELSGVTYVADLPTDDEPHLLRNLALAAKTIPLEARALWDDLRRLKDGGLHQQFNRARYLGGWIIEGKRGGVYQVHLPGVSFLLLPAYVVDRYVLDWTYGDPQFPREMLATVTWALGLYLVYGVVIFRLLLDYTRQRYLALGLALVTVLTLPLADFPFQLYPEVAAGIFIVLVARYILFGDKTRHGAALWFGVLGGYLPWFHPRFLAVSALFLLAMLTYARRRPRIVAMFATGWLLSLGSMAFYAYHVTGSLLPTALYDVRGEAVHLRSVGPGLFGFLFDSAFGVVAQAPVLLVAAVGLPRLIARRTTVALFCGLLVLVTAATGASHMFTAALTTPGRYLVGVMPFAALALAEAIETFKTSRVFKIALALATAISLQTAWVYNLHHVKEVGQIVDHSVSGWRLNLLFPTIQGLTFRERAFSSTLLWFWVALYVALIATPIVYRVVLASWRQAHPPRASYPELFVTMVAGFAVCGWLASDATGRMFDRTYLMPANQAGVDAARAASRRGAWFGVSSTRGRLSRRELLNASFDGFALTVSPLEARAGEPVRLLVWPRGGDPGASGSVDLDFGDGTHESVRPLVEPVEVQHTYSAAGYYDATGRLFSGVNQAIEHAVVIVGSAPSVDLRTISGVPNSVVAAPATLRVSRLTIREGAVCVAPAASALWIATRGSESWQARSFAVDAAGCAQAGRAGEPDRRGHLAMFVVTTGDPVSQRSEPIVTFWPSSDAMLHVPVVTTADGPLR